MYEIFYLSHEYINIFGLNNTTCKLTHLPPVSLNEEMYIPSPKNMVLIAYELSYSLNMPVLVFNSFGLKHHHADD